MQGFPHLDFSFVRACKEVLTSDELFKGLGRFLFFLPSIAQNVLLSPPPPKKNLTGKEKKKRITSKRPKQK